MKVIILLFVIICFSSAKAQLTAVDRNTGRIIPCDELRCTEDDSTYETTDRICLNCFYRVSDSTMQATKNAIIQKCTESSKTCAAFKNEQKLWEAKREKAALREGNKYKGGTMEMTEYVRTKLIMTNKRVTYLKRYLSKL